MGTRIYRWKGKKYSDETLGEAPQEFLELLASRGVEVPQLPQEDEGDADAASKESDED